jgi:hypothetical protein
MSLSREALRSVVALVLLMLFAQGASHAFDPGEPYFIANGYTYDGDYKFAVPCGMWFTIGLGMRIYPSDIIYMPDDGRPVQSSGDLSTPSPPGEKPWRLGCNPSYPYAGIGNGAISVLYLRPGKNTIYADVQKDMGGQFVTWHGTFIIYVVRIEKTGPDVTREIDFADQEITYKLQGYDGTGQSGETFEVMWDDDGNGSFTVGPKADLKKTWRPDPIPANRRFNSAVGAIMIGNGAQGGFGSALAAGYPVKIRLSVNVGTDNLADRQQELDLLGWRFNPPIPFDPNPFFPTTPLVYWSGLTDYAKVYWRPPWEGDCKIWGVHVGPNAWNWKREETYSFVYHEQHHCFDMRDVRDYPNSLWHKLCDQVGPFWIAATEMKAWGNQMHDSNCSYRCVDHAVIEHFRDNYENTNVMAYSDQSPLSDDVRTWLRNMVGGQYGWYSIIQNYPWGGTFTKMAWGEGDWQHMPTIHAFHMSPPKWKTYDPCD